MRAQRRHATMEEGPSPYIPPFSLFSFIFRVFVSVFSDAATYHTLEIQETRLTYCCAWPGKTGPGPADHFYIVMLASTASSASVRRRSRRGHDAPLQRASRNRSHRSGDTPLQVATPSTSPLTPKTRTDTQRPLSSFSGFCRHEKHTRASFPAHQHGHGGEGAACGKARAVSPVRWWGTGTRRKTCRSRGAGGSRPAAASLGHR